MKVNQGKNQVAWLFWELGCGYRELQCSPLGRLPLPPEGHLVGMKLGHSAGSVTAASVSGQEALRKDMALFQDT